MIPRGALYTNYAGQSAAKPGPKPKPKVPKQQQDPEGSSPTPSSNGKAPPKKRSLLFATLKRNKSRNSQSSENSTLLSGSSSATSPATPLLQSPEADAFPLTPQDNHPQTQVRIEISPRGSNIYDDWQCADEQVPEQGLDPKSSLLKDTDTQKAAKETQFPVPKAPGKPIKFHIVPPNTTGGQKPQIAADPNDPFVDEPQSSKGLVDRKRRDRKVTFCDQPASSSSLEQSSKLAPESQWESESTTTTSSQPSPQIYNLAFQATSPERKHPATSLRPALTVATHASGQRSADGLDTSYDTLNTARPPSSGRVHGLASNGSIMGGSGLGSYGSRREDSTRPPGSAHASFSRSESQSSATLAPSAILSTPSSSGGPTPAVIQHISDLSLKRISTLTYMKKAHEGQVFWFNTVEFKKKDIERMPYFDPAKLGRRAVNNVVLGCSIPAVTEPNSTSLLDYLRSYNALLNEFDSYQQLHPLDGTTVSSLSRARIPQMFRRAAGAGGSRTRRTSDAVPNLAGYDYLDNRGLHSGTAGVSTSPDQLLPGEEYSFLLVPHLPFEPDYWETFATLCDVLIDSYTRIITLVSGMEAADIVPGTTEMFAKLDGKIRKIVMNGIVREFEDQTRQSVRSELSGLSKLTFGGLV